MFDGTEVRRRRDEMHLSAREVADRIGVSRPYIHLIETGQRVPKETIQKKLLSLLEIAEDGMNTETEPEPITQEPVPEHQFQKNPGDDQVNQRLPHNTVISVPMLFGMVQGSLLFIESTIRDPSLLSFDFQASGTVVDINEQPLMPRKFTLEMCQERVRLFTRSPVCIIDWVSKLTVYTRIPDVAKRVINDAEFVWFTGYVSMFRKVQLSNQILGQPGNSFVLDKTLKTYMESPKHISIEHLHEQPRTLIQDVWDEGTDKGGCST